MDGYWFKSTKFEIEPGEDDEINPGIYGRQLAQWLRQRLIEKHYIVEDIINEDWGRCLMCNREPFKLWVGCANMTSNLAIQPRDPPPKEDIIWRCFVVAEVPHYVRFLRKVDTAPAIARLYSSLAEILRSEREITFVETP